VASSARPQNRGHPSGSFNIFNHATVASFGAALDPVNYVQVPGDWFVAIGDVVQSTPAIASGRYKDVNLAGAATIAGILNACPGKDLPFAFAGDGGIVLVPSEFHNAAQQALKGVQQIGRNVLSLDIRCALVPVHAVRSEGRDIKIVSQALGPARKLAMIAGGGIDCAEAIAKSANNAAFIVNADAATTDADLTGLSCRWQPLQSRAGLILTLIVRTRDNRSALSPTYRTIYDLIQRAIEGDFCPVAAANLKSTWPPRGAARERAFGRGSFEVYGTAFLAAVSDATGIAIAGFDGRAYRASLPSHSDYRKFADSLRMVIDCSEEEANKIESILKVEKAAKRIDYGLHRASSALMTCYVGSTNKGGHIHFIDGSDGGYALAAQELKDQIQADS